MSPFRTRYIVLWRLSTFSCWGFPILFTKNPSLSSRIIYLHHQGKMQWQTFHVFCKTGNSHHTSRGSAMFTLVSKHSRASKLEPQPQQSDLRGALAARTAMLLPFLKSNQKSKLSEFGAWVIVRGCHASPSPAQACPNL